MILDQQQHQEKKAKLVLQKKPKYCTLSSGSLKLEGREVAADHDWYHVQVPAYPLLQIGKYLWKTFNFMDKATDTKKENT